MQFTGIVFILQIHDLLVSLSVGGGCRIARFGGRTWLNPWLNFSLSRRSRRPSVVIEVNYVEV